MFQSATLKLTGWYLLILMTISLLFSAAIYTISSYQINIRLERLQTSLQTQSTIEFQRGLAIRVEEAGEASIEIIKSLFIANVLIVISGGVGSHLLARRTLRPIQKAHESQSRFTSDASHELRTPMAAMKAEIEVTLRDKKATKDELKKVIRSNLEEVEKLSRLSEMLLNLSRLDHGKLEQTAVNLYETAIDVLSQYNQPDDRIVVKSTKHSFVMGNKEALTELVSVLVDNALKYSPDDSLVVISLSRRSHHFVCFEITNTGPGIDESTLPFVFDRFYRADSSRTSGHQKGYGLGLSLAKKIIELHNGELSASSIPNHATTFTVLLPMFQKIPSLK